MVQILYLGEEEGGRGRGKEEGGEGRGGGGGRGGRQK